MGIRWMWIAACALPAVVAGCYEAVDVCVPQCGIRVCGPDPQCELSCGTCDQGRVCQDGRCVEASIDGGQDASDGGPDEPGSGDDGDTGVDEVHDAGFDAGSDEGAQACPDPDVDCTVPDSETLDYQGLDQDADGWGACCDCEDGDPDINPGLLEDLSDQKDNDCNGLVDEPGGRMVPVPQHEGKWIDAFEISVFSSPDCTGTRYGEGADDYPAEWPPEGAASVTLYACSLPAVIPSGHLSWLRARRACEAQGKRLCHENWWKASCWGEGVPEFPYGPNFIAGYCNDAIGGEGQPALTGSYAGCRSLSGTHDMSGNMSEWLQTWSEEPPGHALVAGFSYECELYDSVSGEFRACDLENEPMDEWRVTTASDCVAVESPREEMPFATLRPYLGTRCCYEAD